MATEAGHIQLLEYRKTTIPYLNWMFEDIFCLYGVSIPYYLLDFSFPDYQIEADWPAPYSPEWLELYKPGIPTWPELPGLYEATPLPPYDIQWPSLYGVPWPQIQWPSWFQLPGTEWPEWQKLPWVDWPKLPELPRLELPPWPEMELPEWERLELEWPEWDWPEWELAESEKTRWRGRRGKRREWPVPWWPFKPEFQRTWPYETEWRGITWPSDFGSKPEWQRTWPYKTEWRGITWLNGFGFNIDQGEFGYNLPWFNELLGLLFDEADLPRIALPDLSPQSMAMLNTEITALYEAVVTSADYTFNSQTKDGQLGKIDDRVTNGSWNQSWTEMEADTPSVADYTTIAVGMWGFYAKATTIPPPDNEYWGATKERGYLSFDTSSLTGKTITVATLKIYIAGVANLDDYETDRTVNLYSLAWGTLDATDWSVGTLQETFLESALSAGAYYTITLTDTSIINKTGETQFQFAFKADVDGDTLTDPIDLYVVNDVNYYRGGGSFIFNSGDNTSNKPVLTVTATG